MGSNSPFDDVQVWTQMASCENIPDDFLSSLWKLIYQSNQQNRFSEPMPWIGMYIALASLFCILAMVADLLHGLRNRKLWFPCKYFTLNAASLTVIAVVTKLPMDLNNSMPGDVDQAAKLGSMAFMCTMMANLLPSLATMDGKELVTNIIAFGVLVITLVVNVCIQIKTGVISYTETQKLTQRIGGDIYANPESYYNRSIAIIYVVMLLMLLIIHICSSLAILKSKQILESKYQASHEKTLKDIELQQPGGFTVEKLKQQVSNYWIMAGTGSPQFMSACSATSSASGVICALSTALHIGIMTSTSGYFRNYMSDYKWSTLVILIIQFVGVIVGTIAPLFRCFTALSFDLSINWIWHHIKVFRVESYWTQKLSDWKQSSIPFSFRSRKCKVAIENLKTLILRLCIGFQKTVVVTCKMIALIPLFIMIIVWHCFRCWKWLKVVFSASGVELGKNTEKLGQYNDLRLYVLQLEDDMEPSERKLKCLSKSANHLIQQAEQQQPNNLMKLVVESIGFEGVTKFDSDHLPTLLSEEYLYCWSLSVVSLTTIAISLPNIDHNMVDRLVSSVSEGLVYVTLVEESLNATDDYVNIQKAAKALWLEVEVYHKWLGNNLQNCISQGNITKQILQWFRETGKNTVIEVESTDNGCHNDKSIYRSICANSMYRITKTILMSYHNNINQVSQEELFTQLSSMISHILAACLTNLPQVIAMKCHSSAIEEREASVHVAAQLLGETAHIINTLQDREVPSLNPDDLPFLDKWRDYLKHPFP